MALQLVNLVSPRPNKHGDAIQKLLLVFNVPFKVAASAETGDDS